MCKCKCKFDGRKCNLNQNWNNGKYWYYIWNPVTCSCENGKHLGSFTDDSVIMCDEITEKTKTLPTNFNEKMQSLK